MSDSTSDSRSESTAPVNTDVSNGAFASRDSDNSEGIRVHIMDISGRKTTVEVPSIYSTVSELKARIELVLGIPPERQRLIHQGRQCTDHSELNEFRIQDGSTVHIVARSADPAVASPEITASPVPASPAYVSLGSPSVPSVGGTPAVSTPVTPVGPRVLVTPTISLREIHTPVRNVPQATAGSPPPANMNPSRATAATDIASAQVSEHGILNVDEQTRHILPDRSLEHIHQSLHTIQTVMCAEGWGVPGVANFVGPAVTNSQLPFSEDGNSTFGNSADGISTSFVSSEAILASSEPNSNNDPPVGHSLAEVGARVGKVNVALSAPQTRDMSNNHSVEMTRRSFAIGQWIDCLDTIEQWLEATILSISGQYVLVHYNGWPDRWNEWIHMSSPRIAPFRTRTHHITIGLAASPLPVNVSGESPAIGLPQHVGLCDTRRFSTMFSPEFSPTSGTISPTVPIPDRLIAGQLLNERISHSIATTGGVSMQTPEYNVEALLPRNSPIHTLPHVHAAISDLSDMLGRLSSLGMQRVAHSVRKKAYSLGQGAVLYNTAESHIAGSSSSAVWRLPYEFRPTGGYSSTLRMSSMSPASLLLPLMNPRIVPLVSFNRLIHFSSSPGASAATPSVRLNTIDPSYDQLRPLTGRYHRIEQPYPTSWAQDVEQDVQNLNEIRAISSQIAPILDRLGRVLTDMAPHVANMAGMGEEVVTPTTFRLTTPLTSSPASSSAASGSGSFPSGAAATPAAPSNIPSSLSPSQSPDSEKSKVGETKSPMKVQTLLSRIRSNFQKARESTASITSNVQRLLSEINEDSLQPSSSASSAAADMGKSDEDPSSGLNDTTIRSNNVPLKTKSENSEEQEFSEFVDFHDVNETSETTSPRWATPRASSAEGAFPVSKAPLSIYHAITTNPAVEDAKAAGYLRLVRMPVKVQTDITLSNVRQPGYSMQTGDQTHSLFIREPPHSSALLENLTLSVLTQILSTPPAASPSR